ncbi:MAG: hypothetical protein ACFFD2_26140 [Promethearchaeota archaeon]
MVCKKKGTKIDKVSKSPNIKNLKWSNYPEPEGKDFGHGKFCYFISCQNSELPIRDYIKEKKPEPHYENKSYNIYASCNQRGIMNAYKMGISYFIFYTRCQGKSQKFRGKYFITGLFPIAAQTSVPDSNHGTRKAFLSDNPIYLSIEDSIKLDNKIWQKWFKESIPKDYRGAYNLHFMPKFVTRNSIALKDIMNHFNEKKTENIIDKYVNEIKNYQP